jgi:hypothetical protein
MAFFNQHNAAGLRRFRESGELPKINQKAPHTSMLRNDTKAAI